MIELDYMNSQKHKNRLFKAGFALPSIMIASLILISVLIVSVTGMSALRVALKNQYYGQLAQVAAEAGVEYAKSCLKANNGVATWAGSTLKINTDCRGNETLDCPPSTNNASCYVVSNGNIQTYFQVNAPTIDRDGKAGSIVSMGYTELSRGSTGQPWRTFSRTAPQLKYSIPLPTFSASGCASCGYYRADENYYYYVFEPGGSPIFTVTGGTLLADILVVGGGGSGGVGASNSNAGGGGGGGGISFQSNVSLSPGNYTVTVGSGGASQTVASTAGNSGGLSSFVGPSPSSTVSITAQGGGGGGASSSTTASAANGLNSSLGSGGGGGSSTFTTIGTGGLGGTGTGGFNGGSGHANSTTANRSGGGGGGSAVIGSNGSSTSGGNGGNGVSTYSYFGTGTAGLVGSILSGTYYFAGGGGGGSNGASNLTVGSGGNGGGSAGGWNATASNAASARTGSGSGGTGGGASGAGGSGFVALRFARNAISNKVVPTGVSSSNLVLFLDAANPASYPGTGTTWFDLSGNSNNATLVNSPTYSPTNGGVLTFSSGSSQYATINHASNLAITTGDMTIISFIKMNTLKQNQIIAKQSATNIAQPYDYSTNANGTVSLKLGNGTASVDSSSSNALSSGQWAALSVRYLSSTTKFDHWILNSSGLNWTGSTLSPTRTDASQTLLLGKNNSGSVYLDADVGMIAIYNTSLSGAQIVEVMNTFRNRYGI